MCTAEDGIHVWLVAGKVFVNIRGSVISARSAAEVVYALTIEFALSAKIAKAVQFVNINAFALSVCSAAAARFASTSASEASALSAKT